jgi:hypothetical protein
MLAKKNNIIYIHLPPAQYQCSNVCKETGDEAFEVL